MELKGTTGKFTPRSGRERRINWSGFEAPDTPAPTAVKVDQRAGMSDRRFFGAKDRRMSNTDSPGADDTYLREIALAHAVSVFIASMQSNSTLIDSSTKEAAGVLDIANAYLAFLKGSE